MGETSDLEERFEAFDLETYLEALRDYLNEKREVKRGNQLIQELLVTAFTVVTAGAGLFVYLGYVGYKAYRYAEDNGYDLYQEYEKVEDEETE